MLDASAVELVLLNDGARIYNSEVGLMVNLPPEDRPPTAQELVSTRPGLTTFMASIDDAPTVSSILAVHRATPLSSAEGSLVEALASQLKVRNENERLFHETVEQRSHLSDVIGNTVGRDPRGVRGRPDRFLEPGDGAHHRHPASQGRRPRVRRGPGAPPRG
jgi:hypothetical protein